MEGLYEPPLLEQLDFPELVQGEEEWKALREKMGATASRFGAAYGVGYISRQRYMAKRRGEVPDDPDNIAMAKGRLLEDYVVELYRKMVFGERPVLLGKHGFRRYAEDPRIGGSPDRICEDPATGEKWVLEIKTTTPSKLRDEVPYTHMCQMQGLMAIYGVKEAHYACWGEDHGLFIARIPFSEEFWFSHLFPALSFFCDLWDGGGEVPRFKKGEGVERKRTIMKLCHSFTVYLFITMTRSVYL